MPAELGKSFAAALIYSTAAVSIVFFVSSVLKRSMSATIVGLLALLMVLPIIAMIITLLNHEPWYIVTYSANLITSVLGGSRFGGDPHEQAMRQFTPTFAKGMAVMVAYAINI